MADPRLNDRFERFAAIDWSGANTPRQPGIAVALCSVGHESPALVRPGHIWSRAEILDWLLHAAQEAPTLFGFDLSPTLPFADADAYFPGWSASPGDARALWQLVEEIAGHEANLGAQAFVDHPEVSRYFRRHNQRTGDRFGAAGSGRLRVVEIASRDQRIANPYSCFNLVGAAQVGKSCLTGMRLFRRIDGIIPIWPLDPIPTAGSVVVEIYTSIAAVDAGLPRGRTKLRDGATLDAALARLGSRPHKPLPRYSDHATDALLTAAWLRARADRSQLWSPGMLTPSLAATEGWTFGVG